MAPSRVYGLGQLEAQRVAVAATTGHRRQRSLWRTTAGGADSARCLQISRQHPVCVLFGFGVLLNAPGDSAVSVSAAGDITWALAAQNSWTFAHYHPERRQCCDAAPIYGQYADAVGHAPPLPAVHALFGGAGCAIAIGKLWNR